MKPDGGDPRRLYGSPCCVGLWSPPIWSPDGKLIAFSADSAGGISVMGADGKQRHQLSEVPTEVAWQPPP
jgi:Tol biopolymer transport system component